MSTIKKRSEDDMQKNTGEKQGTLYMVATPIGNLEDITLRAIRILKEVDLIAAEDTRHSRILLSAYDIRTPLISLHEHNEKERSRLIISRIQDGFNIAYISDAGTPCISDPGYQLVGAALQHKINVVPVPGASAVIAALSVCGFPADRFLFCGFLPPKENKRRLFLESLRHEEKTIILYESPKRIFDTLRDIFDILGDRQIVVARELTKVFEEVKRGKVSEILEMRAGKAKGEFTLILQGFSSDAEPITDDEIQKKLLGLWTEHHMSLRDAVQYIARQTGASRKKIYDIAVKTRQTSD